MLPSVPDFSHVWVSIVPHQIFFFWQQFWGPNFTAPEGDTWRTEWKGDGRNSTGRVIETLLGVEIENKYLNIFDGLCNF